MAPPSDTHQPKSGSIKDLVKSTRPPLSIRRTATGQIIMTLKLNHKPTTQAQKFQSQAQATLNRKRRHLTSTLPSSHPLRKRTAAKGVLLSQQEITTKDSPTGQIPDEAELRRVRQRKHKASGEERDSASFNISCTRLRHMWERNDLDTPQEVERQTVRSKMEQRSRQLKIDQTLASPLGGPFSKWKKARPSPSHSPIEEIRQIYRDTAGTGVVWSLSERLERARRRGRICERVNSKGVSITGQESAQQAATGDQAVKSSVPWF